MDQIHIAKSQLYFEITSLKLTHKIYRDGICGHICLGAVLPDDQTARHQTVIIVETYAHAADWKQWLSPYIFCLNK